MAWFIYIPTTEGLVQILSLVEEDPDVQSVVCLNNSTTTLAISSAYHQFVRKGSGLIHKTFGHGAFRLDLSARIDQGNSWQLAVYLAHAAQSKGVLGQGQPGRGDTLIWASGELNRHGDIKPVSQLAEKMAHSHSTLQQGAEQGARLLLLCAETNASELNGLSAHPVTGLQHIEQALALLLPAKAASQPVTAPTVQKARQSCALWLGAITFSIVSAIAVIALRSFPDAELSPKASADISSEAASNSQQSATIPGIPAIGSDASLNNMVLTFSAELSAVGQSCQQPSSVQQLSVTPGKALTLPSHRLCQLTVQLPPAQQGVAALQLSTIAINPQTNSQPASGFIGIDSQHWQWLPPFPSGEQHFLLVLHPAGAPLSALQQQLAQWQQQEQRFSTAQLALLQQQFSAWAFYSLRLQGF